MDDTERTNKGKEKIETIVNKLERETRTRGESVGIIEDIWKRKREREEREKEEKERIFQRSRKIERSMERKKRTGDMKMEEILEKFKGEMEGMMIKDGRG